MLPDRALSGPHLARLLGEWRSSGPAYASLARAVRLLVLDGRLPLRTRLPGERELAEALGVSRTTATAAYAALRDEGFLASKRGAGSWTRLPADAERRRGPRARRERHHRPQLRGLRRARGGAARGAGRRDRRVAAPPARAGLRRGRAARAARRDRRVPDHARRAHDGRPDPRHQRRPARLDAPAAGPRRPWRPRPDRAPDLPGRARRRARDRRPRRARCRCSPTAGTSTCSRPPCARPRRGSRT